MGCPPRVAGAGLTGAGRRRAPREGPGTPVARAARCPAIPRRPIPALPGRRPREPPPASPAQTPRKWGGQRGAPRSQPPRTPETRPGISATPARTTRGAAPPTCTPRQQPRVPKLVRDAAPEAAALPPAARALPSLPVRKKASTSESAAPPSSAAPSGGFMAGGGRPRGAGGRRRLRPRAARSRVGGGRGAQRLRPQTLRTPGSEGGRLRGGAGAGSAEPPSSGGARRAGGACRRLPHGPPPRGRWPPAVCRGRARPGSGLPGRRSCSAAAAGSPPRPSARLYCSAPLGSPLYFSSSLPPSLSLCLLPPSLARSLARSPALWLPLWLPPPPRPPPGSSPGSRARVPANNERAAPSSDRAPGRAGQGPPAARPPPRPAARRRPLGGRAAPSYCPRGARPAP